MCYEEQAAPGAPSSEPEPEPEVVCEGTMCIDQSGAPAEMPEASSPEAECREMQSITADQLQCIFPMLGSENAELYATAASDRMGELLQTSCGWAAFLGNAAIESKELTIWKEIKCKTAPPYCGRGPLQLTGVDNYNFCADLEICDCPGIAGDLDSVNKNADIGFGTASCVWGAMFGYSLTELADGTRDGFLKTCCTIHQGHFPCQKMSQYQNRVEYWQTATMCLDLASAKRSAALKLRRGRANATVSESPRPADWGRPAVNQMNLQLRKRRHAVVADRTASLAPGDVVAP